MNTYRITVAYDGTAYRGWQRQENTELTVQGILERQISEIAGKKPVVSGSGRTDSGVHALGQECSLYLEQEIDMDSFKKQLNALLPEDIRVLDISREKRDFHARKSAVGKCYEYQIDLRDKMEVFHRKYRFHFPHPVDIAAMEKAAEYLMGTHDFSAFTDLKEDKDTVRTIYAVGIVYGYTYVIVDRRWIFISYGPDTYRNASGCGNRENKSGRDTGDSESERPEEIWFSGTGEGTVFRPCFLYRSGA